MLTRSCRFFALVFCVGLWPGISTAQTWDHVHLTASDTAAAAKWYAKHFEGEVTKSGPFDAVLFGSNLMKFKKAGDDIKGSSGSTLDHIAFSVEDEDAVAEALGNDGAEVEAPNRRRPGFRYATDPWGTKIEVFTDEDLLGFHHVLVKSPRPATMAEWYTGIFGGEVSKFGDAVNMKAIRYGDMYLFIKRSIRPYASTMNRSVDHTGWRFKDFDATIKKLKDMDVKFLVEPTESDGHMIAFIESPWGVKIEIVEDVGK